MKIWFDMDGTIADLYGVENWLDMLIDENPAPYALARPLVDVEILAASLNRVQNIGCEIGIISWLSKNSTAKYDIAVTDAKISWLARNFPTVRWDVVKIVPYGTNKRSIGIDGILFDDEQRNRLQWGKGAYAPSEIFKILDLIV